MNREEPDFRVLEYLTVTKDPRPGLVVAIGRTEQAAGILQRSVSSTPTGRAARITVCLTACPSAGSD
ncbi:hypothetical protein [Streptomyces niveus]|uniref:hypothetical protein n=1 Tax=Streptomyces niveus TaxID=193462 RepID=UPI0035D6AC67